MKNQQGLQGARRLFAYQAGLTLLLAAIAILVSGTTAAVSALLGGFVCIAPSAYFAKKLFQYHGARAAKQIASGFYKGEAIKMVLSVILFALVFKFFKLVPLMFFTSYIVVQLVFWFAPLIFFNRSGNPRSKTE